MQLTLDGGRESTTRSTNGPGLPGPLAMAPATRRKLQATSCKLQASSRKLDKEPVLCYNCYALKGCYVFKVVQEAQYKRLKAIRHPDWVKAMALLINSKKADVFRWHDSGDVQDKEHLQKIYEVCRLTPSKRHWMPTREAWIKDHLKDKPANLVIRLSSPMVDQGPVSSWPNTSTVVTSGASCPAPKQNNECGSCRQCWDSSIKNISYGKH